MTKDSLLARNVATNLAAFLFGIGITFVLSPFIIRTLGDARYGAWALIAELLGYYGLLDLGIRGAVTFHVATYLARGQLEQTTQLIASAFWTLAALGAVAGVGGVGLAFAFPHLFVERGVESTEVLVAMSILAVTIGASLPMEVFSAGLVAQQRLDLVNAVDVVARVLVAVGIFVVLNRGGGLVELAALQAGGKVFTWLNLYVLLKWRLPAVSLRPALFRREELRALTNIGSKTFLINIAQTVLARTDLVLIAAFMEIKWVTYYTLGRMLILYTENAVFEITRAYTPRLTELYAKQDREVLHQLYFTGTRYAGTIAIVAIIGVCSFATFFLQLWVGSDYVTGPLTMRSDMIVFLLGVAHLPRLIQSISRQLIFASGRLTFLMWLTIAEAAVNIALSIALVGPFGLAGIAMGTLIPLVLSQTIAMSWYMRKDFGISQWDWLRTGLARPLAAGAATLVFAVALRSLHPPESWAVFGVEVLVVCLFALLLGMFFVLTAGERGSILARLRP